MKHSTRIKLHAASLYLLTLAGSVLSLAVLIALFAMVLLYDNADFLWAAK